MRRPIKIDETKPQPIIHELLNSVAHVLHFQSITTNTNESMPFANRPVACVVMISIHRQRPHRINKNYMRIHFLSEFIEFEIVCKIVCQGDRLTPHAAMYPFGHFNWEQLFQFAYGTHSQQQMRRLLADAKHHESHHIAQCTEDTKTMCADDGLFPPSFHWSRRVSQPRYFHTKYYFVALGRPTTYGSAIDLFGTRVCLA